MNEVIMFDKLREYLTKEYMRLADRKEEMMSHKIRLEAEENKTKDLFFHRKKIEGRKRMFSPLDDSIFEFHKKEVEEESEISIKIQQLENNVNSLSMDMNELKDYITFLQSRVKEKEDTFGISDDLKEMLLTVISFLQSQYPKIEFLTDFEEVDMITSTEFNGNLIRIITYTISSTIESIEMDSVIVDVKKEKDKINIKMYMLLEDEVLDYYTYDFNLMVNKGE